MSARQVPTAPDAWWPASSDSQAPAAGALVRVSAERLLHGSVRTEVDQDGWRRPWRFSQAQMHALGSCQAWHPGLYRQMARCTAGVRLEFQTDSSEVAVEVRLDQEPAGTRDTLAYVDDGPDGPLMHDGVSCDVDGRALGVRVPAPGETSVTFTLDDPNAAPADGVMQLPGMGDVHRVRVWLPCLRGCAVRDVVGNGSFVRPVEGGCDLLVLGDSIAQGYVCDDPSRSWAALLADELGLGLVNQGVGGQVFQPGTLSGLARCVDPVAIVVEFGENYRYEPCRERQVALDVRGYLAEVSRLWPEVPTWVVTPLWHDEEAWPSHSMSCFSEVPELTRQQVNLHPQMHLVEGGRLLDHRSSLLADGYEHPGPEGSGQVARRLALAMEAGSASQQELGQRALALLARGPRRTMPLAETVRRGGAEVLVARKGCVALRAPGGLQMMWAKDAALARDVAALLDPTRLLLVEPSLADEVGAAMGLSHVEPCHLAIYRSPEPVSVDGGRTIRPLDESYLEVVRERMSHPEYQTREQTLDLLRAGSVLGGFEGDDLVGFVGEQPEGSMGMLEVLPDFRRHGWGLALEGAKVNQVLGRGQTPWCDVWPQNKASVRLQRRLGLTVLPVGEACYLS